MKYKLAKKAYEIDFSKIDEGYLYDSSSYVVYADTRNKAKTMLLEKSYCENICLSGEDEEVTYLTIPVIRCKDADKFFFEGKEMSLFQIEEVLAERKRISVLDEILDNENIKYCYIRKGSYYRPNKCGYTDFRHRAGVYLKGDAVESAKGCRDIWLERIDIDEHNKMKDSQLTAHEEAFELMDKKGMSLGEKMRVRAKIIEWSGLKEEYPFISSYKDEDMTEKFQSTYDLIRHFVFNTREEVVLANAIYLNMSEIHGSREFESLFKFTCRIIGLNSNWA